MSSPFPLVDPDLASGPQSRELEAPDDDPQLTRAKARLGQVLQDKWTLESLLGVGGMAAVYAATHRNGKRVAVKMLHAELGHDAEIKRRFLREGYVANAVDHPGTVKVLDDDVAPDGAVFIVMELLEGETLDGAAPSARGQAPRLARGPAVRRPAPRGARRGARSKASSTATSSRRTSSSRVRARSRSSTSASRGSSRCGRRAARRRAWAR